MGTSSEPVVLRDPNDPRYDALTHFKDWSNYLLVATVAAAGWVGSDKVSFTEPWLGRATLWCLGLSIVLGIFTLAFVPLLAEQLPEHKGESSIYKVPIKFSVVSKEVVMFLPQACRPQHVTFIAGVLLFCWGTVGDGGEGGLLATIVGGCIALIITVAVSVIMSVPMNHRMKIGGQEFGFGEVDKPDPDPATTAPDLTTATGGRTDPP